MKTIAGMLFVVFLAWAGCAGAAAPKIGEPAPLLKATALLDAPSGARLDAESLRGKVVILEFWATWCGPCVAAIPHLNELAEQFKDKPVQFVAITAEDEAKVEPFLKKRPIKAWVALDTTKAMNEAYGVGGIPHTVILDKEGRLAAVMHPEALTAQVITDVLAGKKIPPPPPREPEIGAEEARRSPPLFELMVRPSLYTNREAFGGSGQFTARAYTVLQLLPRAFDQAFDSTARLVTNTPLPEGTYDFTVAQKRGPGRDMDALEKNVSVLLQQLLNSAFGLTGRKETRELEVLLLKTKEPHAPGLVVSPTPGQACKSGPGVFEGTQVSMKTLAMAVENAFNKPVFDETGLTNTYDISLKWDEAPPGKPNPERLRKALLERLGLELVPSRRAVEVVVIEGEGREDQAATEPGPNRQ